jgi:predicted Zn-dependent protease
VIDAANTFRASRLRPDNRDNYLNRIAGLKYNKDKKTIGRIQLVRVRPGDTFASLARSSGIPKYAEQKIRLLNGMFPKGEPRPGQLIKIVR